MSAVSKANARHSSTFRIPADEEQPKKKKWKCTTHFKWPNVLLASCSTSEPSTGPAAQTAGVFVLIPSADSRRNRPHRVTNAYRLAHNVKINKTMAAKQIGPAPGDSARYVPHGEAGGPQSRAAGKFFKKKKKIQKPNNWERTIDQSIGTTGSVRRRKN